jgi:hypothetical protein
VAAIGPAPGDPPSRVDRYPGSFVLPSGTTGAAEPSQPRDEEA